MRQMILPIILILILMGCWGYSTNKPSSADLVIFNGKVVTLDDKNPVAEAIAVKGDRILHVGSDDDMKKFITPSSTTINAQGKLVIPGLIEGHGHFGSLGISLMQLNLAKANNFDDIVAMVKEAVAEARPGEWILGRGWHQEKWDKVPQPHVDGLPFHTQLSEISPNNPVWLLHASEHSAMANQKAMDLAKISDKTVNPSGGEIVKDERGNPIGHFRETAQGLVENALRDYQHNRTESQLKADTIQVIELAMQRCLQNGITSFHDAGVSFATIDTYRQLADEGRLSVRLYLMVNEENGPLQKKLAEYKMIDYADHHLTVRSIKRLIDGALGAHGAWLLEPYADMPSSIGLNTYPVEDLQKTAQIAIRHGFQLCVHAIGDRGNRETLDVYQTAFQSQPGLDDLRWRIEHAQHIHPDDISRFGELGVIAAMQGIHCTSDGPWITERLGSKRANERSYVWQKLMQKGVVVANGTDVPVEDIDPMACYYASVTRRLNNGTVFLSDQRMSRIEALKSYTINNAYAAFEEDLKGTLTLGKLADITVLSHDILTCPEEDILAAKAIYTIVGGKVLYERTSN